MKKSPGSGWKPRTCAIGVAGSSAPTATTSSAASMSGMLGWLWKNGTRRVRIAKTTSVWVASDSTNQPVRNWSPRTMSPRRSSMMSPGTSVVTSTAACLPSRRTVASWRMPVCRASAAF
jgi:hypothetical protein